MAATRDSDTGNISVQARGIIGFFSARWNCKVALERLFWRDMILVGTAINVATTVASLILLAAKAPLALSIVAYLLPLPYNLFLSFTVWRTAERFGGRATFAYQMGAVVWLIVAILI